MSWVAVGVGASVGLASYVSQEQSYQNKKQLAAQTQRYSPWTGNKASLPNAPSPVSDIGSGAATGAMFGQGLSQSQAQTNLANQQANWLQSGYSPYGGGWGGGTGYDPQLAASSPWSLGANTNLGSSYQMNPYQFN